MVGRGGKRGKTSGRGTKGQNARAGHKKRPEVRDAIKKLPKLRGRGVNSLLSIKKPVAIVSLATLERNFSVGALVNPNTLRAKKLFGTRPTKFLQVKVLGNGSLLKALKVTDCKVSASAREAILKAGGSVAQ